MTSSTYPRALALSSAFAVADGRARSEEYETAVAEEASSWTVAAKEHHSGVTISSDAFAGKGSNPVADGTDVAAGLSRYRIVKSVIRPEKNAQSMRGGWRRR